MDLLFPRCAGIDCHKQTLVVCRLLTLPDGTLEAETRTFGTTSAEILRLSDWLTAGEVTHVAMESTGVYWRPVFNLLEGNFSVWILNAHHVKNVPGRKTDVKDAQWLADLLRHGLVQPSFIPDQHTRDLRDLTRERTNFVQQRSTLVNRIHKTLEATNIKLGDVVSNLLGVSGRAILDALLAGERDAGVLADLAKGRARRKRAELEQAVVGRIRPPQAFVLGELLRQVDQLSAVIARFDAEIQTLVAADSEVITLLDTIPGVNQAVAETIVAELGTDMSRYPSAAHAAAWAGVAPGNNESAGKRRPGKTRKGNRWLRHMLVQAAHGAAHSKDTYLAAQFRRIARRRGTKRAICAVAHSILVIAYHIIARREPYRDLGGDYFEQRNPEATARRLIRRVEQLGYQVVVTPPATAA